MMANQMSGNDEMIKCGDPVLDIAIFLTLTARLFLQSVSDAAHNEQDRNNADVASSPFILRT